MDAFNAIPTYAKIADGTATVDDLRGLESVNATYAFSKFPEQGFEAFVPVEDDPTTEEDIDETNPGTPPLAVSSWQNFFNMARRLRGHWTGADRCVQRTAGSKEVVESAETEK